MKQLWNRKGKRLLATLLTVLLVWNLCPQMGFAVSAASTVSGNEATPSDANEATGDTELDEDESDEFADGDLENDLASPSDAEELDEEELLDGILEATPSDAVKEKAFEQFQTIDGITVRVTADKGVFPEDAKLHVELVEDTQLQEQIQTAVEETTGAKDDPKKTVEKTMAFDITILDSEGNELQPDTEQGQVKVSFEKVDTANVEAGKSTLEVFHLNEGNTQAEKLDAEVDVDAKTVEVQAEHFSVYALGEVATQADGDVAKVTTSDGGTATYHATIEDAVTAANAASGSTLTLLSDIGTSAKPLSMTSQLEVTGNFTLDFAGNTIYFDRNPELNATSTTNFMYVTGTLVIVDNGAEGKTGGISGNTRIIALYGGSSNATIEGGTYQTSGTNSYAIGVFGNSEVLSISGGVFKNKVYAYSENYTGTITGGTFVNGLKVVKPLAEVISDECMMYKTAADSTVDLSLKSTNDSVYVKEVTGNQLYIRKQPSTNIASLYEGYTDTVTLTMEAVISGNTATSVGYQWYQKDGDMNKKIEGEITSSYTLPSGLKAGTYTFYCEVSGNNQTLTSNDVTVTVNKAAVTVKKDDGTISNYDGVSQAIDDFRKSTYIITLNKDIETTLSSSMNIISGTYVTIDLNGYKWSIMYGGYDYYAISMMWADASLTIIDSSSSGSGSVYLDSNMSMFNYGYDLQGTVQLGGGTYNKLNVSTSKSILADGYGYFVNGVEQTITADTVLENVTVRKPCDPNLNLTVVANPKDATITYDGTAKNISTTKGDNFTWVGDATASVEGYYTKSGDVYTKTTTTDGSGATTEGGAPVYGGIYYVRVVVAGGDSYSDTVSDYMKFEIIEKKPEQINGIYQISTAEELMWFAAHVNDTGDTANKSANAVLTADIDMAGITWVAMGGYAGTLDGTGHTISNLTGQNLIRTLASGGTVKNITFDNANVLVGVNIGNGVIAGTSYGTISGCVVTNSYLGYGNWDYCGGIAGRNDGIIQNCAVLNSQLERMYGGRNQKPIGGITDTNNGTVQNCYTYNVTFTDASAVGGIVASGTAPTDSYFYTTATMTSTVDGTAKTVAEFASGEVAWLMNGSYDGETFTPGATDGTQMWYQDIGTDDSPVLESTGSNTVYQLADGTYSNTKPVISGTTVQGHSLTLDGTIGVNFYVEFDTTVASDAEKGNYYVEVSNASGTSYQKMTVSEMLAKGSVEVTGNDGVKRICYKITGNVAAKEMTDTLTLKLMKTGVVEPVMTEEYSVAKYYQEASSRDSESLKALTKSMVGYGAYAQQYFNYQTGNLPIALDQIDLSSVDAAQISTEYELIEVDGTPVTYYGSSLTLETDTRLEHYFQITGSDTTVEQLTFKIGDTKVEPSVYDAEKKIYYIDIKNIHAKDLELADTVTVGNGTDVYVTLSGYSPLTFIKRALEYDKTSEKLKPLVKALYLYWKEADTYDYPNEK